MGVQGIGPGISDSFARRGPIYNPFIHYGIGVPIVGDTLEDEWGVRRSLTSMKTESRIVYHPLRDADVESLDHYPFPDPYATGRFRIFKDDIEKCREGHLITGSFGCDTFWCNAWYLRGFNQLVTDLYSNPDFFRKLMDKLLHYYLGIGLQLAELGVDVLQMADDVAMQTGMIISPRLWREYIEPYYKKLIAALKPRVGYIYYHSDGDLRAIIPDLIEIGVDILNSIQPDCMDLAHLKEQYGEELTLWGGISVQRTLPYGTVEDVNKEIKRIIGTCAPGGGFVLGTSNNVTQDTPMQNFLAMYKAAAKYGEYQIR